MFHRPNGTDLGSGFAQILKAIADEFRSLFSSWRRESRSSEIHYGAWR